mmetsp:Transcript_5336/g.21546  ORF Transcript_5336/g.21546 Transcript_5336/m.21546 type:complete len:146 (-) Transcript_5336:1142-1579(-)
MRDTCLGAPSASRSCTCTRSPSPRSSSSEATRTKGRSPPGVIGSAVVPGAPRARSGVRGGAGTRRERRDFRPGTDTRHIKKREKGDEKDSARFGDARRRRRAGHCSYHKRRRAGIFRPLRRTLRPVYGAFVRRLVSRAPERVASS